MKQDFRGIVIPLDLAFSSSYKAAATGELGKSFEIVSPGKKKSLANAFLNQIEQRSVAGKLHLKWLHPSIKRTHHLNVCKCSQLSDVWVPSWWETKSKIAHHCFLHCLPSVSPSSFHLYMLSCSIHQVCFYSLPCVLPWTLVFKLSPFRSFLITYLKISSGGW